MAINLGDNIKIQSNLPIDYRYFNNLVPYASKTEVINTIPVGERYLGLTVNINNVEYWFKNAILVEDDLVLKINDGTLTGATNGLSLSGTSIILGGSSLTIPTIITRGSGNIAGIEYDSGGDISSFVDNSLITKKYADYIAVGVHPKAAAKVATTGNILPFPPTGLTGTTIDGFTGFTSGMRVLIKDQTNQTENGVYSASTSGWGRTSDFDGILSGETVAGTLIPVITGATNRNTLWVLVEPENYITGNTQNVVFTLFGSPILNAGTGITINGSTINVNGASLAGTNIIWNLGTSRFDVDVTGVTTGLVTQSNLDIYTGATQPILNAAITGATNGLYVTGQKVHLGGALTGNTILDGQNLHELRITNINGFQVSGGTSDFILEPAGITLAFSGQSVSFDSDAGLTYGGDYSANFVDNSLITKKYADSMSSGSTLYNGTSPSTLQVGGMPPNTILTGRTWVSLLEEILVEYLVPSFSTFYNSVPSIVEVGTVIGGLTPFTWLFANSSNVALGSMCVCDVSGSAMLETNTSISSHSVTLPTRKFSGITPTFGCGSTQLWSGHMKDTNTTPHSSSNYQTTALLPYFWGRCNCPGPSGANRPIPTSAMVTGGTKVVAGSSIPINITFNATSGNDYIWFAIPSQVIDKNCWCVPALSVGGVIGGAVSPGGNLFPSVDTDGANNILVTSACWSNVPYDVYISNKQTTTNTNSMTLTRI